MLFAHTETDFAIFWEKKKTFQFWGNFARPKCEVAPWHTLRLFRPRRDLVQALTLFRLFQVSSLNPAFKHHNSRRPFLNGVASDPQSRPRTRTGGLIISNRNKLNLIIIITICKKQPSPKLQLLLKSKTYSFYGKFLSYS